MSPPYIANPYPPYTLNNPSASYFPPPVNTPVGFGYPVMPHIEQTTIEKMVAAAIKNQTKNPTGQLNPKRPLRTAPIRKRPAVTVATTREDEEGAVEEEKDADEEYVDGVEEEEYDVKEEEHDVKEEEYDVEEEEYDAKKEENTSMEEEDTSEEEKDVTKRSKRCGKGSPSWSSSS